MYECLICYDNKSCAGEITFLECSHFLCSKCFNKLQKTACPFCRSVFSNEFMENKFDTKIQFQNLPRENLERNILRNNLNSQIRIRVRRNRFRLHTTSETINSQHGTIIIETGIIKKTKKYRPTPKPSYKPTKNSNKRSKWGGENSHRGIRISFR